VIEFDVYEKDPDARLDYEWDWSDWLEEVNDTIDSAVITVPTGLTLDDTVTTSTTVTGWFTDGELGKRHQATCRVTTVDGRIDDRTIVLHIVHR
jgi:hypothetical protein